MEVLYLKLGQPHRTRLAVNPSFLTVGVARTFDWGGPKPQITCNNFIINFKKGTFWGAKISLNGRSEIV